MSIKQGDVGFVFGKCSEKSEGVSKVAESKGEFTRGGVSSGDRDCTTTEGVNGARPLLSAEQSSIWPEVQSINGLHCFSQLYPRTEEQEEFSGVT